MRNERSTLWAAMLVWALLAGAGLAAGLGWPCYARFFPWGSLGLSVGERALMLWAMASENLVVFAAALAPAGVALLIGGRGRRRAHHDMAGNTGGGSGGSSAGGPRTRADKPPVPPEDPPVPPEKPASPPGNPALAIEAGRSRWGRRVAWPLACVLATLATWLLVIDLKTYGVTGNHVLTYLRFAHAGGGEAAGGIGWMVRYGAVSMGLTIPAVVGGLWLCRAAVRRTFLRRIVGGRVGLVVICAVYVVGAAGWWPLQGRLMRRPAVLRALCAALPADLSMLVKQDEAASNFAQRFEERVWPGLGPWRDILDRASPADEAARLEGPGLPNIVLIACEGLRMDAIEADTMPGVHAWGAGGLRLDRHYAGSNCTHLGLFELLYGRSCMGYHLTLDAGVPPQLCTTLRRSGYRCTYVSCVSVGWQRINEFINATTFDNIDIDTSTDWIEGDRRAMGKIRDIVAKARPGEPQFAMVFLQCTHLPYLYPAEHEKLTPVVPAGSAMLRWTGEDRNRLLNRYRNAAGYLDELITTFLGAIDPKRNLVVVTGDHGESFFDDGTTTHASRLSEIQTRTPMIIVGPNVPAAVHRGLSVHADLLPTLLHAAGGAPLKVAGVQGLDLLADRANLAAATVEGHPAATPGGPLGGQPGGQPGEAQPATGRPAVAPGAQVGGQPGDHPGAGQPSPHPAGQSANQPAAPPGGQRQGRGDTIVLVSNPAKDPYDLLLVGPQGRVGVRLSLRAGWAEPTGAVGANGLPDLETALTPADGARWGDALRQQLVHMAESEGVKPWEYAARPGPGPRPPPTVAAHNPDPDGDDPYERFPATQPEARPTVLPDPWPQSLVLDLGGRVTMKMALVPAGKFLMGSPPADKDRQVDETPHEVTISRPFYMGVYEVTQEQWRAVMGTEPWKGKDSAEQGPDRPASYISWNAAERFARRLANRSRLAVRLPTEAQWEYACRAGSQTRFCFGDDLAGLGDYAWYEKNAQSVGQRYPHPVGRKKPNAWGLYDMHGNVCEWCADRYEWDYYGRSEQADPPGPQSGTLHRVIRGGSFELPGESCRSACRGGIDAVHDWFMFGLRVAVIGPGP